MPKIVSLDVNALKDVAKLWIQYNTIQYNWAFI